ncbi:MAG: hypothetical protein R3B74_01440 [Nitrospirales bacterium]
MEDAVEGDQGCRILIVALGQLIPDQDHGDASGQSDENEPGHVFGGIPEKGYGKAEHKERADEPILHERHQQYFPVTKDQGQLFVFYAGQRGIHHEDEADGDGKVGGLPREAIEEGRGFGEYCLYRDAPSHRQNQPGCKVAIEKRETTGAARGHVSNDSIWFLSRMKV